MINTVPWDSNKKIRDVFEVDMYGPYIMRVHELIIASGMALIGSVTWTDLANLVYIQIEDMTQKGTRWWMRRRK